MKKLFTIALLALPIAGVCQQQPEVMFDVWSNQQRQVIWDLSRSTANQNTNPIDSFQPFPGALSATGSFSLRAPGGVTLISSNTMTLASTNPIVVNAPVSIVSNFTLVPGTYTNFSGGQVEASVNLREYTPGDCAASSSFLVTNNGTGLPAKTVQSWNVNGAITNLVDANLSFRLGPLDYFEFFTNTTAGGTNGASSMIFLATP